MAFELGQGKKMEDIRSQIIKFSKSEMLLYQSGVRRGHADCLKQIARELKNAAAENSKLAEKSGEDNRSSLIVLIEGFQNFAEQLDKPTGIAIKEHHDFLNQFLAIRPKNISRRIKNAISSAVVGWKQG